MNHEPTRLLDDVTASAGLRRDLAAAAGHRTPYDVTAGAARLEASLAKGAGAASSGWGGGMLGVGALILGGLIGAGTWLSWPETPAEGPTAAVVAAAAEDVPEDMSQMPGGGRPAAEDVSEEMSSVPVAPTIAPAGPPEEVLEDMSDRTGSKGQAAQVEGKKTRSRRGPARAEAASGRADGADYLREARSLQAARGFLGRDPALALRRAEAGALEFAAGAFAQEWEGVAILALFELGRQADAERRGTAFLARYPNGPYAAQVREALDRP